MLRLAPDAAEPAECAYRIRLLARDDGSPSLADAVTVLARFAEVQRVYLPLLLRQK